VPSTFTVGTATALIELAHGGRTRPQRPANDIEHRRRRSDRAETVFKYGAGMAAEQGHTVACIELFSRIWADLESVCDSDDPTGSLPLAMCTPRLEILRLDLIVAIDASRRWRPQLDTGQRLSLAAVLANDRDALDASIDEVPRRSVAVAQNRGRRCPRALPRVGCWGRLAHATGGFLVAESPQLRDGLVSVAEARRWRGCRSLADGLHLDPSVRFAVFLSSGRPCQVLLGNPNSVLSARKRRIRVERN
jgi:hypothetical protein